MSSSSVEKKGKCDTLILSPHIDDEVLGCSSYLSSNTFVCYFGVEDRPYVSAKKRLKELKKLSKIKQFEWTIHKFQVNHYIVPDILSVIHEHINEVKPERILIPAYSYNQDHQAVYDAGLIATRPHDKNWFVNNVLIYEQPHTFIWPYRKFEPNYFRPMDVFDKVKCYKIYKSQVRQHRSPDVIIAIAKARGAQANMAYAEAFQCLRHVER